MKRQELKPKLINREVSIGSWITMGNSIVTEVMAQAGFEWLTIDMEHSAIDMSQAQELIRIIELSNVVPLVRISNNNPDVIKHVMDAGAHGVIVPMVNSKREAEEAVKSVKYPTFGIRSVGLSRAQKYGFDFNGYREWLEKESIVIVQIEHIEAINNLEAILCTSGVDGSIIGPYDLSGSLGCPGEFDRPEVKAEL
ncbi:MAG: aldolase/citrate lyase family protein, partial [Candidatus Ratteibacteria bacterium]|nr:aldolase/citrate lyase family protein [Candidatus Ratteibacteria bacterium]